MKAIIVSGISGSGKTTWIENYINNNYINSIKSPIIINLDLIRYSLFKKYKVSLNDEENVLKKAQYLIKSAAENNNDIILDLTIYKNNARLYWYKILSEYYSNIELIILYVNLKTAITNNNIRITHRVSNGIIKYMFDKFEEPSVDIYKYFSSIIKIDNNKD